MLADAVAVVWCNAQLAYIEVQSQQWPRARVAPPPQLLTDAGLAAFAAAAPDLPSLRSLVLSEQMDCGDAALTALAASGKLTGLTELVLDDRSRVTDEGLLQLTLFPKLESLGSWNEKRRMTGLAARLESVLAARGAELLVDWCSHFV